MKIAIYDSDLTDAQWDYLKPMLPKQSPRGRPPTDRRLNLNAILYVIKGGIQWRLLLGTLGLVLGVPVTPASTAERDEASRSLDLHRDDPNPTPSSGLTAHLHDCSDRLSNMRGSGTFLPLSALSDLGNS